ncbi:MAG: hypothetical protein ACE5GT_03955 [Rhodospirillales bacterium]
MPAYLTLASGGEAKPARTRGFGGATPKQVEWLAHGLDQPGGKLPLFDDDGQRISERTVRSCIERGWAIPWFRNPIKPDWQVCRLTEAGRQLLSGA